MCVVGGISENYGKWELLNIAMFLPKHVSQKLRVGTSMQISTRISLDVMVIVIIDFYFL